MERLLEKPELWMTRTNSGICGGRLKGGRWLGVQYTFALPSRVGQQMSLLELGALSESKLARCT